jgi:hypothetical protein
MSFLTVSIPKSSAEAEKMVKERRRGAFSFVENGLTESSELKGHACVPVV